MSAKGTTGDEHTRYLRESTVIEEILHHHQIHLRRLRFAVALVLGGLLEGQLVTAQDFSEENRSLKAR